MLPDEKAITQVGCCALLGQNDPLLQLRYLREAAEERVELAGLVQCKDALQYMKLWATAIECVWQVVTVGAKNVEQQGLTQLSGMQEWSALVFFLDGTPTQASAM